MEYEYLYLNIFKTCMHTYPHLYVCNIHIRSVIVGYIKKSFSLADRSLCWLVTVNKTNSTHINFAELAGRVIWYVFSNWKRFRCFSLNIVRSNTPYLWSKLCYSLCLMVDTFHKRSSKALSTEQIIATICHFYKNIACNFRTQIMFYFKHLCC